MEPQYLLKPISAFKHENVLYIEAFLTIVILLYCYYQCKLNNNLSYVDKLRGILPIIYCVMANIHHYYHKNAWNSRLLLITLLTTLWGIRMVYYIINKLTKRGKFQQDSRWDVLYTFIYHPQRPFIWELYVFFVANLYQISSWFVMVNMPLFIVYHTPSLLCIDYGLSVFYLCFLIFECIADYEMTEFRKIKFNKMLRGHSIRYTLNEMIVEKGGTFYGWKYDFLMNGLRKYCRFPNYLCELGLWFIFYLFSIMSTLNGRIFPWISVFGFIGYLSLCFKLNKLSKLTEGILSYSYGSYYRYHATNNRFLPWFARDMILDQSVSDDNLIEETYLSEKLLIRLRRMDKYRIFSFKYDDKLIK